MQTSCEVLGLSVSIAMAGAKLGSPLLLNATLLWVSLCSAMYVLERDGGILDHRKGRTELGCKSIGRGLL